MSTQTPTTRPTYPGRDRLNDASAHVRRAFAAVFKEGRRHDPKLIPQLEKLVMEAAETLGRIAADAEALEQSSVRHQRELKRLTGKNRALLKRVQRAGSTRGVATLQRIDAYLTEQMVPEDTAGGTS